MSAHYPLVLLLVLFRCFTLSAADVASSPEFQRIGKLLQKAQENGDHLATYDYALQANALLPMELFVDMAIGATYRAIDMSKAETSPNAGISERWLMRTAKCPAPGEGNESIIHFQYFMIRVCLACYAGNVEHDFDAAGMLAAEARKHLEISKRKDMSIYRMASKAASPEAMVDKVEQTARRNKSVQSAGKVAAWIRGAMSGKGVDASESPASSRNPRVDSTATTPKPSEKSGKPQFERYARTAQTFKVTNLGNMGGEHNLPLSASGGWVTVYDSAQNRKLSFNYGDTLGTKVGDSITVIFDSNGVPVRLRNLRTHKTSNIQEAY